MQAITRESDDAMLLDTFRTEGGKSHAFRCVLEKYQKKVYWHVRRIVIDHDDADDVVQNTFIKVWENLEKFREDSRLYTWIFRIATNEALLFLNRKKAAGRVGLDDASALVETLQSSQHFDGNAAERKLQTAILMLPEKQRLVFNMKYYGAMKYEEMEEVLGTSTGALKASYHHAVKKIEAFLRGS